VAVGDLGVVRGHEADQEPGDVAVLGLGQPGRPGEVLEPQARQQLGHVPAAPPIVDDGDDRDVVRLGRPAEAKGGELSGDVVSHGPIEC
jgi:hypothetical protein